jgi:hypothetical protein
MWHKQVARGTVTSAQLISGLVSSFELPKDARNEYGMIIMTSIIMKKIRGSGLVVIKL